MTKTRRFFIVAGVILVLMAIGAWWFLSQRQIDTSSPNQPNSSSEQSCVRAGCSNELCVSADQAAITITTCEYKAEYACYQTASCELLPSGECGFVNTPELQKCLEQAKTPQIFFE